VGKPTDDVDVEKEYQLIPPRQFINIIFNNESGDFTF
jgi:hypothetical protein